jgi:high-affinity iron transporter
MLPVFRRGAFVLLVCLLGIGGGIPAEAAEPKKDYRAVVAQMVERGETALADYRPEDGITIGMVFSTMYYDAFEGSGMEMAVAREDEVSKVELESRFSNLIGACMRSAEKPEVMAYWQELVIGLDAAAGYLEKVR